MADSNRELIVQRIEGLLNGSVVPAGLVSGATKPPGLNVHRYRGRPLQDDDLPAQVVYTMAEPAKAVGTDQGVKIYQEGLLIRIEHRVIGVKAAPDRALDVLISWSVQVIMADERQGGLAMGTEKLGTQWDPDVPLIKETYAAAATDFRVTHRTLAKNPEVRS